MMMLSKTAVIVNGQMQGADVHVHAVNMDSRAIENGALFVAISGAQFDGHDFVAQAAEAGAVAALVEQFVDAPISQVKVDDCTKALGQLAANWRTTFDIPVVGVTGSNGKTTVSAMVASIFNEVGEALAPKESFNNHWGVPITLLALRAAHDYAVIEMGMNHAGEIDYLTHIAKPSIALINNVSEAHLQGLGSIENIAKAKQEIYHGLIQGGVAVLNIDDPFAASWFDYLRHNRADVSVFTFSCQQSADLILTDFQSSLFDSQFTLRDAKGQSVDVNLPVSGTHNARNALAASACAYVAGVALADIAQGLSKFTGVKQRVQIKKALIGSTIIDDSFNANPASMRAGIDFLGQEHGHYSRRIAVLGNMAELGDYSVQAHQEIGHYALHQNVDFIFALQEHTDQYAKHYGDENSRVYIFTTLAQLLVRLNEIIDENTLILVKGSKSANMSRVVAALSSDRIAKFAGGTAC